MEKKIDGRKIQAEIKIKLKQKIDLIDEKLKLVVIQVGNDPASNVYIKNKSILCEEMGVLFEHKRFDNIKEEELIEEIKKLNEDKSVTGILVQFPIPKDINENRIIETISPLKDVDGLTSENLGRLFSGNRGLVPCTALGVMEIFKYMNVSLKGKCVSIVGRSKLVGLPLISLFLREDATVNICHSMTNNLKEQTRNADILIVAIGKKEFINKEYIKDNAIVIDVGINRFDGKLYGDCDYNSLYEKCDLITPVPGGVGPLTVVMLINNIIEAYNLQK